MVSASGREVGHRVTEYYYEDLEVGQRFTTRTRIVTSSEVELFSNLLGITNPAMFDAKAAARVGFSGKITPGVLISAFAFGLEYQTGVFDNIVALLEIDQNRFKAPLMHGQRLRSEIEVVSKRETSRQDRGIVVFQRHCYADDVDIAEAKMTFLYSRRDVSKKKEPYD